MDGGILGDGAGTVSDNSNVGSNNEGTIFAEERQMRIVEFVQLHRKATVAQLTSQFGVSSATIRNDLRDLERRGFILRTHGGAMAKTKSRYEEALQQRQVHNQREKEAIAQSALTLIDDGDTIILDAGTTALELAKLLYQKRDLTIITNDISVAGVVCDHSEGQLILVGGLIRKRFRWAVGSLAEQTLSGLLVDKAFMAANSFDLEKGASTPDLELANTKRAMMSIASRVFLLCDHEKFGTHSFAQFARVDDFDTIITDRLEPEEAEALSQLNVQVLTAET